MGIIYLKYPESGAELSVLTDIQKKFLQHENPPLEPGIDYSKPAKITCAWADDHCHGGYYTALMAEDFDITTPVIRFLFLSGPSDEITADFENFRVGKKYYWCMQKNARRTSRRTFFVNRETPRCLNFEGTTNVRDIGGYKVEGGFVQQNKIIRGAEIDRNYFLTQYGIDEIQRIGIKTEIDLRAEILDAHNKNNVNTLRSPLESFGIKCVLCPVKEDESIFSPANRSSLINVLNIALDPASYPLYIHCSDGAVRTGAVMFLLGALLGLSDKELENDFEFSRLSLAGLPNNATFESVCGINYIRQNCKGDDLRTLVYDLCTNLLGFSAEKIESFRASMISKFQ